jgi:plasmid stabilization system protein ParE
MSYTIEWSRRAVRELRAIRAYIAADAPKAADRGAAELEMLAESLSEMPGRGRRVGDAAREVVAGRYLLRYRIEGDVVLVVRVKHSAQSG